YCAGPGPAVPPVAEGDDDLYPGDGAAEHGDRAGDLADAQPGRGVPGRFPCDLLSAGARHRRGGCVPMGLGAQPRYAAAARLLDMAGGTARRAAALVRVRAVGAAVADPDEPVGRGQQYAALPRRPAEHPDPSLRGSADRRRQPLAAVLECYGADALADDLLQ